MKQTHLNGEADRPYTLVAELTYRCPLRCLYCSNPTVLSRAAASPSPSANARTALPAKAGASPRAEAQSELSTEEWTRVMAEAEALGAMQLNLSGGEPLARTDLEALISAGRKHGFYVNLITSAVGLSQDRLLNLRAAGLDAIQISFQDEDAEAAARMAGRNVHAPKLAAAAWARAMGIPLTVNVVMHRENLGRIAAIITMAERLGADRLELANAQYLGWALANRDLLLPDRASLDRARATAAEARLRFQGRMEILFVQPDYHTDRPRACMDGWGRRYLIVNPYGQALPCQAAASLPNPVFENVRQRGLKAIWELSQGFNAFRGEAWMSPTCRGCEFRAVDHGGCRCQAFQLTGDAAATDPACSKSPHHHLIQSSRARADLLAKSESAGAPARSGQGGASSPAPIYRTFPATVTVPFPGGK